MAALPPDWEEKFSAQHQRAFYRNAVTGESSWIRPAASANNPAPSSRRPPPSARVVDSTSSGQATLPAGWSESYSQQHRRVYYKNSQTGETSWTRPVVPTAVSTSNPTHRSDQTKNPLGEWTEVYSETHKRSYFRNVVNGETSWTRPAGAATSTVRRSGTRAERNSGAVAVCVFGGGTEISDFTCQGSMAEAETFDMREWQHIQMMDLPRGGCAAVAIGSQAYVFGGGRSAADIQVYDCAMRDNDGWRSVGAFRSTRLLTCLQGIHCPAVAKLDGLVYLVGGQDSFGALASVHLYIPKTERICHLTSMRVPRAGCSCATMGDLLYIVGGRSGVFSCTAAVFSSVETYDPVDDVWGKIANMSEPRDGCAAVACSGRLYVLGGNDKDSPLNSVEVFDPGQGTWSYVAPMSTARHGVAAVEVPGNKILACGGWDGSQLLKSCELYDVELDQWSDMSSDMALGRMYHGICALTTT
eukprot:COSAG02_NODE_1163_length_14166_cov_62.952797_3_plen_471_part_00